MSCGGVSEAAHVAYLGREDDRDQEGGAAHRLISLDDRRHGPGRHDDGQLPVQAMQPLDGFRYGLDLLLEDNLLSRVLEGLTGEPAPVRQGPVTASVVDPPVTEQEGQQLLALAAQVVGCRFPGPHHVADGFVDPHTPVSSPNFNP